MARFTSGWIKLHRSMIDSDIGQSPHLLSMWVFLLMWATRFETKIVFNGKQVVLPPGSVVFGMRELANKLHCSTRTAHKWVHYLNDTGRLVNTQGTRGCYATICNWEQYQEKDLDEEPLGKRQVNARETPGKRQVNLNGEVKKERSKEEKNLKETTSAEKSAQTDQFEEIYKNYPKRKGDQGKKRAFLKLKSFTEEELNQFAVSVENYRKHCARESKTGTEFVKQFLTFVNSFWEEWVIPPGKQTARMKTAMDLEEVNLSVSQSI